MARALLDGKSHRTSLLFLRRKNIDGHRRLSERMQSPQVMFIGWLLTAMHCVKSFANSTPPHSHHHLDNKCPPRSHFTDKRTEAEGGLVTSHGRNLVKHRSKREPAKQPSELPCHSAPPAFWGQLAQSLGIRGDLTIFFPCVFLSIIAFLHRRCISIEIRKNNVLKGRKITGLRLRSLGQKIWG